MSDANGYVPTPEPVANLAASTAFGAERPGHVGDDDRRGRLLLPGLGTGNLYDAVHRYCTNGDGWSTARKFDYPLPECVAVETNSELVDEFEAGHPDAEIDVHHADFLLDPPEGEFDWVLANPPFVCYQDIDAAKRDQYRERFRIAQGQFDMFVPFFEQSMRLLKPGGTLLFILPLPALLVPAFEPFRKELRDHFIEPIFYLPPETFAEKVETVMVGVEKQPHSRGHHLWLEALRGWESREILSGLGVDDVDDAVDRYYDEHAFTEEMLKWKDDRERRNQDGGRQSGLEAFTGGTSP
ncbi:Eco57I restriction-modification methylase domain-containing protein [Natrinema ejinorense]|uniref:site-specific DNA-methyltransferase (adenine-specific) n=1 Tax=Natrinema ejinorense TaxID=373386 RepID=A0A2A5QP84_9EURY|nr:hypothetical protein [Natrinema ejinorense]PCR88619.1 hypothetical protein CP557_21530 [Natrinema ejinorense]